MPIERALFFAYGTLMRGEAAHELLGGACLVGTAHTEPCFSLLDMGEYPALVEGGNRCVAGELYEIDASLLEALDRYEDAPELYVRRVIRIGNRDAVTYMLRAEHAAQRSVLVSDDWRKR